MALSERPLFPLGRIGATPGALAILQGDHTLASMLVTRHNHGDFGDICDDDAGLNIQAIKLGRARIMSVYKLFRMGDLWIITDADRSATTILTPGEY